jgi:hypothetical protein
MSFKYMFVGHGLLNPTCKKCSKHLSAHIPWPLASFETEVCKALRQGEQLVFRPDGKAHIYILLETLWLFIQALVCGPWAAESDMQKKL